MTITTTLRGLLAPLFRPTTTQRPGTPGRLMGVRVSAHITAQGDWLHDLPDGRVMVMAGGTRVAGYPLAATG